MPPYHALGDWPPQLAFAPVISHPSNPHQSMPAHACTFGLEIVYATFLLWAHSNFRLLLTLPLALQPFALAHPADHAAGHGEQRRH